MHRVLAVAVVCGGLSSAPTFAAAFDLTVSGTIVAHQGTNQVAGLGFDVGDSAVARWRVDLDGATPVDATVPTLVGPQRFYIGAISRGRLAITGAGGNTRLRQLPASFGAVLVLDNYLVQPAPLVRLDQVSITDGPGFRPGFVETYTIDGPVPAATFLRQINFGVQLLSVGAVPPALLTSVAPPDFAALLATGAPKFFNFSLARGVPVDAAALTGLPTSNFVVGSPQFNVAAVPEPAGWAMLVAGFGLVGAAMRRRAATSPGSVMV